MKEQVTPELIEAAPELAYALKRCVPWLGKMIADGAHQNAVMPNDAVRSLQLAEAALEKAGLLRSRQFALPNSGQSGAGKEKI